MVGSLRAEPARVVSDLRRLADWKQLFDGRVDAIHLTAFAGPKECTELVKFIATHPRTVGYDNARGILRLGNSFSDVRKSTSGNIAGAYASVDIVEEALGLSKVISQLLGVITASWPYGLETYSYRGVVLHRAIARRIIGAHAEPHDDNISKEVCEDAVALTVKCQLGVNLYLEMPEMGGELEGWHRQLNAEEYDRLRNPEPDLAYGVRRDAIGNPDWEIRPGLGDVIIFKNTELHAIRQGEGSRTTWGFFLGYRGDEKPLLVWS